MGGRCWVHGWAFSKAEDAARTVSSSYFGPMIWRPTGNPSGCKASGYGCGGAAGGVGVHGEGAVPELFGE